MLSLIRYLLIFLMLCIDAQAEDAAMPPPVDPDAQWLSEMLMPYGGFHEFQRSIELIEPKLKEEQAVNRLVQFVRRSSSHDLANQQLPSDATETAMRLLAVTKTDDAVDAIALYLKHPLPKVQAQAAENLRITQNPKAVQPLTSALLNVEMRLPSALVANPDTEAALATLTTIFRALSMIRGDDALATLDASLKRLENKYGKSAVGAEMLRELQYIRDTGGIQEYRRNAAAHSPIPIGTPSALLGPSHRPVNSPTVSSQSTPIATPTIVSEQPAAQRETPFNIAWIYSLAAIILGGIGLVFYRNRKR